MNSTANRKPRKPARKTGRSAGEIPYRRAGTTITVALLVLCLIWLFRATLLTGVANFLVIEDDLQPAEFIYLLLGDTHTRPFEAARLYQQGLAPLIVLPQEEERPAVTLGLYPSNADAYQNVLQAEGVPTSAIRRLDYGDGVTSTADEGAALLAYLQENPARRVIVVTSDYHTRRARWNLRRQLGGYPVDLLMAPATDDRFKPANWWRSEEGMLAYVEEYLKWAHNFFLRAKAGDSVTMKPTVATDTRTPYNDDAS